VAKFDINFYWKSFEPSTEGTGRRVIRRLRWCHKAARAERVPAGGEDVQIALRPEPGGDDLQRGTIISRPVSHVGFYTNSGSDYTVTVWLEPLDEGVISEDELMAAGWSMSLPDDDEGNNDQVL
jgi:hypothetical protein